MSVVEEITIDDTPSAITDTSFSASGDTIASWTNASNRPFGTMTIGFTIGAAGTAGGTVNLYYQALNIDGTNDGPVPSANFKKNHLGSFGYDGSGAGTYYDELEVGLPIAKDQSEMKFYIENQLGVTISSFTLKLRFYPNR